MSTLYPNDPDWTGALCAETDPEIFFPPKGGNGTAVAKSICRRCPLLATCHDFAVVRPGLAGVWGGLSERDRRRVRSDMEPETVERGWPAA